jgi:hypothetical protein
MELFFIKLAHIAMIFPVFLIISHQRPEKTPHSKYPFFAPPLGALPSGGERMDPPSAQYGWDN